MGLAALQPSNDQEALVPVDLSAREWQLLAAMRDRKPPLQIAEEWGTSRQNVDQVRRKLARKGVIVRDARIPRWMRYSEAYPWTVVDGLDVRYEPAVPPAAVFHVLYPAGQTEGLEVPPIRVVQWEGWTIQGLPAARTDGHVGAMEHRVVWCVQDGDARSWSFPAPVSRRDIPVRWMEAHTVDEFEVKPSRKYRLRLTPGQRAGLTRCIAAVVGVEAVLELSGPVPL